MSALFEAVPNFSEGRDLRVIDALVEAAQRAGARVLHRTSDAAHNRSVITLAGTKPVLLAAAIALAGVAARQIDLRTQRGEHPRMGALDVLPFIPLADATLADAASLARQAAARIWYEHAIPSYLYEEAATAPHRRDLASVRQGEFEGLNSKCADPLWRPDFGSVPHPSAGAIAIGARPFLIAFNVELESGDIGLAQRIARRMRARNGGLKTLKALPFRLSNERVQVSFNISDAAATPLYRIRELVREFAHDESAEIGRSELIGLCPLHAVVETACYYAGVSKPPAVVFARAMEA